MILPLEYRMYQVGGTTAGLRGTTAAVFSREVKLGLGGGWFHLPHSLTRPSHRARHRRFLSPPGRVPPVADFPSLVGEGLENDLPIFSVAMSSGNPQSLSLSLLSRSCEKKLVGFPWILVAM